MQRRAPPTSPVDRRGRRQLQAPRLRVLSGWEVVFIVSLFVATVFNLYTYSDRRDRFLHAHGYAGDNPPGTFTPSDTLGDASRSTRDIDIYYINTTTTTTTPTNNNNTRIKIKKTKLGGKWTTLDNDAPGGPSGGGEPLGRKRPLQVAARVRTEAGGDKGTYDLRWPSAGGGESVGGGSWGGGGGGGNGEVSLPSAAAAAATSGAAVDHFPCSLTEMDDIPGLADRDGDDGRGGGSVADKQHQGKAWSTSGPCVISCSSSSSAFETKPRERQGKRGWEGERGEEGAKDAAGSDAGRGCARAFRACELYQECTHILLPPAEDGAVGGDGLGGSAGEPTAGGWRASGAATGSGGGGGSGDDGVEGRGDGGGDQSQFATLMHLPARDGSLAGVEEAARAAAAKSGSGWGGGGGGGGGGNGGFTLETDKPRTYYVVSFGGSGSKMLGGWLSERGKGMVKEVFHIHDPRPADKLFAKVARRGVSAGREGRGKDFRGYDFPEGDFPADGRLVEDVDSYRVVMIFKDPAEALVSRYFYNHCKNLRGAECGKAPQDFPSLESYAEESGDRLHMESFYDNYCGPAGADAGAAGGARGSGSAVRNYPVVCVNYHKMWDNKEALVKALGLPPGEASKMPKRTETVRNDRTSAERGEPFTLAVRERLRRKHASLSRKVFEAPAVAVV